MSNLGEFMRWAGAEYNLVRYGAELTAAGFPQHGRPIRDSARRDVRRMRRAWLEYERELRAELGYRDLGGES